MECGNCTWQNFPEIIKLADVPPIFKKGDKAFVENYRPINVLATVSKIFQQIMEIQISYYIGKSIFPF